MLLITLVIAALLITLIIKREKATYKRFAVEALDFYKHLFTKKTLREGKSDIIHSFKEMWYAIKEFVSALTLLILWVIGLPLFALVLPLLIALHPVIATFLRKD